MDVLRSPVAVDWRFPTEGLHDGIPLGNGLFGALLWGEGRTCRLTLNRGDFWHHPAGFEPGDEATYAHLKAWLESGQAGRIAAVFEGRDDRGQAPPRPTRLPLGRVDLALPEGVSLAAGSLDLATGSAHVVARGAACTQIEALMPRQGAMLALRIEGWGHEQVLARPAPANSPEVQAYHQRRGFSPPDLRIGTRLSGWTQRCPNDPTVAVACLRDVEAAGCMALYIAVAYGHSSSEAWHRAVSVAEAAQERGYEALAADEAAWWRSFWGRCARVQLDDAQTNRLYNLGMYRLACASAPGGPAMGLQGPWVEDDRLPPWEADYHFNINVQMCHWPALTGNWSPALEPLWDMVAGWMPRMRANARRYVGITDGLTLPHAVDDRGVAMGGFWSGQVDHASAAWLAHLAWRCYRYSLNLDFLRDMAYPLLRGTLRVYEEMLEDDGQGHLTLPVGVSAEWGGREPDAWGRNASYQLGMIHALAREVVAGAETLGIDDPIVSRCQAIQERLPLFARSGAEAGGYWASESPAEGGEIAVWEGLTAESSHRHFSHLVGLYPLDLFDWRRDPALGQIVARSLQRLTHAGTGAWCGWSFPWAATLRARMGQGDAAALYLDAFRRAFTTPNGGPLIFPRFEGLTGEGPNANTMQLDGGLGYAAAVQEMLVHTSGGVLHVFPAVPEAWREVRLERARAEKGLVVSAERCHGQTRWVRVLATADAELRLAVPFKEGAASLLSSRDERPGTWIGSGAIRHQMRAGEEIVLTPASRLSSERKESS